MAELKPCKCGAMPTLQWRESFTRSTHLFRYFCPKCGVYGESSDNVLYAVEAWNREVGEQK